jgi:hypothetical protein
MGKAVTVEFLLPLKYLRSRYELIILLIGTRRTLYTENLFSRNDLMFRLQSFSEAVDSQTGDQDGQLFLLVSACFMGRK